MLIDKNSRDFEKSCSETFTQSYIIRIKQCIILCSRVNNKKSVGSDFIGAIIEPDIRLNFFFLRLKLDL